MRKLRTMLLVFVLVFMQLLPFGVMKQISLKAHALDDGLARTPPMGWNSWNKFHGDIDEDKIKAMADAMVESGMKDAGYEYINIDDNWMAKTRDENGDLLPDPERFPNGIKGVADYVHSKGLKLGVYSSNGLKTCMGLPASQGNEERDAKKFAEWGVDYLKYDFCYNQRSVPSAYAPDFDKIVISNGTDTQSYEAESGTLGGKATIGDSAACSGGKKVGNVGNNQGDLTFGNITVDAPGSYTLTVYYLNGDPSRKLFVSVNGGEGTSYDLLSTGGWSTVGTYEIPLQLNQGTNTVKFYNSQDNAELNRQISAEQYGKMSKALQDSGRPIVFSICEWGSRQPWLWGPQVGHLWRTTGDISDNWGSMTSILDKNAELAQYAGPGHWNDPDMLEVGNGGMTDTEYRSHFSLWSIMASPLLAGNDISNMSEATKEILLNHEVIAVDQDPLGVQGEKISDDGDHEVFVKPLANGEAAVVLFNRGSGSASMSVTAQEMGLPAAEAYLVRDLWQHADKGSAGVIRANVPAHGAAMFRVKPSTTEEVPASVSVSLSSDVYLEAGQTEKVTAVFTNDGVKPVSAASAVLNVPESWTAQPLTPTAFDGLEAGQSVSVDWNLTAPNDAAVGTVDVEAVLSFSDGAEQKQEKGILLISLVPPALKSTAYLGDVDWFSATNGWGPVEKNTSVGQVEPGDGPAITLKGVKYEKGLGTNAPSEILYHIGGNFARFTSVVGVDDDQGSKGTVTFEVWGDGRKLWSSGLLKGGFAPETADVNIRGVKILGLVVTDGGDDQNYDHGDWADTKIWDLSGVHDVSVADATGGTAEVTAEPAPALAGEKVTVHVGKIEQGKMVKSVRVVDGNQAEVPVTETEEGYTFVMPETEVTVTVELKEVPGDKTGLQSLYDANQNKNPDIYTSESWSGFASALADAKSVLEDADAGQTRVNAAVAALQTAADRLVLKSRLDHLNDLIAACEALDESKFEAQSWTNLQAKLSAAKAVAADPEAVPEAIGEAFDQLAKAKDDLVYHVDKEILRLSIEIAQKTDTTGCTSGSIRALNEALEAAQNVLNQADAAQEEVDNAAKALINAIINLKDIMADKAELQKLADLAAGLTEAKYTPASWSTVKAALEAAQVLLPDDDATQEAVDGAYGTLAQAIAHLTLRAQTNSLEVAITLAQTIVSELDQYAPATVEGLQEKLDAAKAVQGDLNATQEEVDAAAKALAEAAAKARLKANKKDLQQTYAQAQKLDAGKYTEGSVKRLSAALTATAAVLKNENATQQEVDKTKSVLSDAVRTLEVKPTGGTESSSSENGNSSSSNSSSSGNGNSSSSNSSSSGNGSSSSPNSNNSSSDSTGGSSSEHAAGTVSTVPTGTVTENGTESPQTGEPFSMLLPVLSMMALAGMALVLRFRKKSPVSLEQAQKKNSSGDK